MTPAPSVAIVVSFFAFCKSNISPLVRRWPSCWQFSALQAFMSCCYLCSSNIFAMINYVGFATWVSLIIQYHLSFLPTQTNEDDFSSLSTQLSIGLAVFCLPYLRWKHPEWERPIKVGSWSCLIWRLIGHVHLLFRSIWSSPSSMSSAPSSSPLSPWLPLLWRQVWSLLDLCHTQFF